VSGSKQTFLRGALILLVSSVVVKIIGAVFKIPLALLIKEDGMGLFISAYTLFAFFVLASKGVSIAVSKMVSASVSVGKSREADRIFGVAALLLGVIGTAGAAALYLAPAEFLDNFVDLRAVSGIRAISPAVLFVALISAFLGYFQGKQNMIPTAVTDVIEALGKLAVGLGLAWLFIGTSTAGAAVGAIAGVTFSTLLALIFVVIMFLAGKRRRTRSAETMRSRKSIAKELLTIALPITIGASISSLASLVDMATIMNRLQTITQVTPEFIQKYASLIDGNLFQGGIYEQLANQLYGLYTGYAVQLFNMPLTMVVALSTSVLPAISGAVARGDSGSARRTTLSVIRISVLFAAPCAVGLSTLSAPVLKFIFNVTLAHDLLRTVSIAIVFVALVQVTNAILQGYGRMHIPLVNMLIGCLVKVAVNYYLVAMPHINIDGAPIGTLACYFTIAALNIICVIRITGCKFPLGDFIIKPGVSVAGMGIVVVFARNLLSAAHFPERLAVLPAIAAGVLVYTALALLTGAVAEEDVAMLPKGGLLVKHLKKLHLLKA
jgi:stage V sporulation protein B